MKKMRERERRLEEVEIVNQEVWWMSKDEVRTAMKRMKSGKAVGPDGIPVEAWKCLGEMAVELFTRLFNKILESERMPEEWRLSVLVPIFSRVALRTLALRELRVVVVVLLLLLLVKTKPLLTGGMTRLLDTFVLVKNKGDVQSCGNYRGIKLLSHTMKLWEIVEARLRGEVMICEQQYGFMPGKSTTDAMFALRMLMEKYREG